METKGVEDEISWQIFQHSAFSIHLTGVRHNCESTRIFFLGYSNRAYMIR